MKRLENCPVCGSKDIAEYDIALTTFHKFVCRKCLTEWDDSPFFNVDYKPAVPVRISKRGSQGEVKP